MRRFWALALGLALALPASGQADERSRVQMAGLSGSERLRLFALGKLLDTGAAPRGAVVQMKQEMVRQGFYYDPGTRRLIATDAWLSPVLSYDGNINGGVLQDSFIFNGYLFEADPAARAKAGAVLGLSAGGAARIAFANGRYVEARLRGEAVWSPEHRISRSNTELALCSRNHLAGWTFADLCHSLATTDRELGAATSQETALSVTRLFQTGAAYHELTGEVSQAQYDTGDQPAVTLTWGAVWDGAATRLSVTRAAPITGETALDSRVAAEIQWLWGGRAMGLGLWHQRAGGGAFLGTPREDSATGLSLSYRIRPGLTAQVGYMVNRSTADFFDYDQVTFTTRFDALRW